jgi:hypothetical protein
MKQLFQFVQICKELAIDNPKSEDALYFAKPVIGRGLFPSMIVVKSEDKLGKVNSRMDDWRWENGYEMERDKIEARVADYQAKAMQWSSVLKLVDLPDMRDTIQDGVRWMIEKNENPVHSVESIKQWADTVRKRLGDEKAKAYAIKMLDQQAKNRAGDWLKYGKQSAEKLSDIYFSEHKADYPEEVIEVIASRLGHMIAHCYKYPHISRAAALDEMEELAVSCS